MMRPRLLFGAGATLLLAACGQTTSTSATSPEPISWWWLVVFGVVGLVFAGIALLDHAGGQPRGNWEFSGPFNIPLPPAIGIPWLAFCGLLCIVVGIVGAFVPAVLRVVEYSAFVDAIETAIPVLTYFVLQSAGVVYVVVTLYRTATGDSKPGSRKAARVIVAISLLYLGFIHFFTGGLAETFIAPLVHVWQLRFG
jgi:hypothetical protein